MAWWVSLVPTVGLFAWGLFGLLSSTLDKLYSLLSAPLSGCLCLASILWFMLTLDIFAILNGHDVSVPRCLADHI